MRVLLLSAWLVAFLPGTLAAQPSPPSSAPTPVWIRLTIVEARIWPVKADGTCWDFCWKAPVLPPRTLQAYETYLKNPTFLAWTKGQSAPDVRVRIHIGSKVFETPVLSNTTLPLWNVSYILPLPAQATFKLVVEDVDLRSHDIIGQIEEPSLPSVFSKGGRWNLRKAMQVESLTLQVDLLSSPPFRSSSVSIPVKAVPPSPLRDSTPSPRKAEPPPLPLARKAEPPPLPLARKAEPPPLSLARKVEPPPLPLARKAEPPPLPLARKEEAPILPMEPAPAPRPAEPGKPRAKVITPTLEQQEETRFVRLTIIRAAVWPLKESGRCWDGCVMRTTDLPPRGLPEFGPYLTQPSFRRVATGASAPDPWVDLRIGTQEWKTTVQEDTVQPRWMESRLIRLQKNAAFEVTVYDKDAFSSEVIGHLKRTTLPAELWEGGVWRLPTFGQVEMLEIQADPLPQAPPTPPLAKKATEIPAEVQFVKVTVEKAKIWPLTDKGGCWDSCPTQGAVVMPPRGLLDFGQYLQDPTFRSFATGRAAPDPRVKIQLGAYDVYVTPTIENTVTPEWKASHIFRLRGDEAVTVTVSDDDENFAHEVLRGYRSTRELMQKWAEDPIGRYHSPHLPEVFVKGGTLVLRSFGQVESLEMTIEPLPKPRVRPGCEGVYRVRVAEIEVEPTRADGKPWHSGVGSMNLPSPFVQLTLGTQTLETPVASNRLKAVYQTFRLIPVRQDTSFSIEVRDFSLGLQVNLGQPISIPFLPVKIGVGMKRDPQSQEIGQTARFSACSLIEQSKEGAVRLPPFGRVRSALLFFDKIE